MKFNSPDIWGKRIKSKAGNRVTSMSSLLPLHISESSHSTVTADR